MKLKYLGTAAAEAIPAIFCECDICKEARKRGGKNIRTRSQAIVDGRLLIDFPPETYMHSILHGVDMTPIKDVIITHSHADHLYPDDIDKRAPVFSHYKCGDDAHFRFYGSAEVGDKIAAVINNERLKESGRFSFIKLSPFIPTNIDRYTVTPLPARHSPVTGPYIYMISDGQKNMLYAHDTGTFFDEVFDYIEKTGIRFDFVSLDCTSGDAKMDYDHHMNLDKCILMSDKLKNIGAADAKTLFCLNHFSHNGGNVLYEEFSEKAGKFGFLTSYDGMETEF